MKELGEAGVPCSAVLDTRDLFNDPQLVARDFIKTVEHAALGPVRVLGWPARLSASEVPIVASPLLGDHTDEVVAADLGVNEAEVKGLRDRGTIA